MIKRAFLFLRNRPYFLLKLINYMIKNNFVNFLNSFNLNYFEEEEEKELPLLNW